MLRIFTFLSIILCSTWIHGQSDTLWMVDGQVLSGQYRSGGDQKSIVMPDGASVSADRIRKAFVDRRTYYPVTVKSKTVQATYLAERITTGEWELLAIKLLELDAYNRSSYQNYYYLHRDEQTILINRTNPRDFLVVVLNDCFTKDNLPEVTYRQDDLIRVMEAYQDCKQGNVFYASRDRYKLGALQIAGDYGIGWVNHEPQHPYLYIDDARDQPWLATISLLALPKRGVGFRVGMGISQYHLQSDLNYSTAEDEDSIEVVGYWPGTVDYKFQSITFEPGAFWVMPFHQVQIMPTINGKIGGVLTKVDNNKLNALEVENQLPWKRHIPEKAFGFANPGAVFGFESGIQIQLEILKNLSLRIYPFWHQFVFKNSVLYKQEAYRVSGFGIKGGIAVPIKRFK